MSFNVKAAGGYGSGKLGDETFIGGKFNSYYLISAFSGKTFIAKPENAINGDVLNIHNPEDVVGEQFLIHAFAASNGATAQLGFWRVVTIISVEYESSPAIFTTDKDLSDLNASDYFWQAVFIPQYKNLTLKATPSVQIPEVNSLMVLPGGVFAIKCSGALTLDGANIDLTDSGLPTDTETKYRPLTSQESHILDTQLYAGAENSITKDRLLLNCGDGAAFIIARNVVTQSTSRIGNPNSQGVQYCRGSSDSKAAHSGTNVGGSSILIACQGWNTFSPAVISKYRDSSASAGRGLCRAYIAVYLIPTTMLPDEGLYSLDNVKSERLLDVYCNINGYGNGQNGATSSPSNFESYIVYSVSDDGYTITTYGATTNTNKLFMIHQTQKNAGEYPDSGKFMLTRISSFTKVSDGVWSATLEKPFITDTSKYNVYLKQLPEYTDVTISKEVTGLSWSNGSGKICRGNIFALVCNGTLDLRGGKINTDGKGTRSAISNKLVGNTFMRRHLFIGAGYGTVFILAKKIIMDSSTRIGATYDGARFGGQAVSSSGKTAQGGYRGEDGTCIAETSNVLNSPGGGGWGGGPGRNSYGYDGGFFGNAVGYDQYLTDSSSVLYRSYQGAHILIIADTIEGFNLSAISTGGKYGGQHNKATDDGLIAGTDGNGGCGYGGGGAGNVASLSGNNSKNFGGAGVYRGGGAGTPDVIASHESNSGNHHFYGGGSAGAAFIWCNHRHYHFLTGH